jgi:hypothetical protein
MDRDIGLKILPSAVASVQQRLHGFVQEARAAAALFHAIGSISIAASNLQLSSSDSWQR